MAGKLIMLPLRVWFRSACFLTRATFEVAERAVSLAGQTIGVSTDDRSANGRQPEWQPPSPPAAEPSPPERAAATAEPAEETAEPTPRPPEPRTPEPAEAPAVQEPVHVSEEPELVRESAEPGAEEGAGAAVTVLEPWSGYRHMNARDVIARAKAASPAELAAVRLYEARHRSRQTVLAAVDRQLKLAGGA